MARLEAALRAGTLGDADRILRFYAENPSEHVLGRADSVRKACDEGRQFLVESGGEFIAVSGCFTVGEDKLVEVGGTRVADRWQGFGIQTALFRARFASLVFTEPGSEITTAVGTTNASSRINIERMGFERWFDPVATLLVECDPGEGRAGCEKKSTLPPGAKCCSDFYLLPAAAHRRQIEILLEQTKNALVVERKHRERDDTLAIQIGTVAVQEPGWRQELEKFCRGQ